MLQIVKGDTLAVVPIEMIKKANLLFSKGDFLALQNTILEKRLATRDSVISDQAIIIFSKDSVLSYSQVINADLQESIDLDYDQIRKLERKLQFQKRLSAFSGSFAIVFFILLLF